MANVSYGDHKRQVLDIWQAESDTPTPVVFYMHGGGWMQGDKKNLAKHFLVNRFLEANVSVVSINYRYVWQARDAHVMPPVEWPMHDAKRALQFVRSKASDWNLDKNRIALTGGSAGGCTSLWLAFHDDMADPDSRDPIARESTRPLCVAVEAPQTSLDPKQMTEWTPNSRYGHHAFGLWSRSNPMMNEDSYQAFLARRDEFMPWIRKYSPFELASADDPPVYLFFKAPPALGLRQKDPTHSANFGVKLKEKLDRNGVPCELVYPGATEVEHESIEDYLIERLGSNASPRAATGRQRAAITDFEAIGDGTTVNTRVIQSVIDRLAADGGSTVVAPEGVFVSGALFFKPGVHLHLDHGAVLR